MTKNIVVRGTYQPPQVFVDIHSSSIPYPVPLLLMHSRMKTQTPKYTYEKTENSRNF